MPKYRAREIVEAVQFKVGGPEIEGVYRLDNGVYLLDRFHCCEEGTFVSGAWPSEQYVEVKEGDYVVRGDQGFRYSIPADLFEERYEDIGG